jgi:hypothetical protein
MLSAFELTQNQTHWQPPYTRSARLKLCPWRARLLGNVEYEAFMACPSSIKGVFKISPIGSYTSSANP